MTIGERIKMRRKQLDMTADQVADLVGVNRATIYRYESGDIENMGTETLVPLAAALRTTPACSRLLRSVFVFSRIFQQKQDSKQDSFWTIKKTPRDIPGGYV